VSLAFLLRLVFLLEFRSDPTFAGPIIDASTYHTLGVQFAGTREFSDGFFWQ
jgi:hypothetical protein